MRGEEKDEEQLKRKLTGEDEEQETAVGGDETSEEKEEEQTDKSNNQEKTACRFFQAGHCRAGDACKFSHETKPGDWWCAERHRLVWSWKSACLCGSEHGTKAHVEDKSQLENPKEKASKRKKDKKRRTRLTPRSN